MDREPSLREVLELHRSKPLCNSCHSRMDPLGLALENFNAMGMWREKERNLPLDTAGTLITGEPFAGIRDLKRILKDEHRADFYRCLTEKLLTYALGRGVELSDVETVDQIVDRLDKEEGRFSALLMGIIESAPFQKRRNGTVVAASAAGQTRTQPLYGDEVDAMTQYLSPDDQIKAERHAGASRRRFLKGVGACLALPAFESLGGAALASAARRASGPLATSATGAPIRTAFVYFPNGAIPQHWWPSADSGDLQLNRTMQALESVKHQIQVVSGLDHVNATPGPDGAGDHARASGTFLTGVRVRKTAGSDIHAGISIDQVMANQIGHLTRFPSLELSCDAVRKSGNCDSGYSCAYQYNLAWKSPTAPVPPEPNPRLLFERIFGAGSPGHRKENLKKRTDRQRSILDFVLEDARDLQGKLGARDRGKLDEYLRSVREIELRIEKSERLDDKAPDPDVETPAGIPGDYEAYIQLMFDMLVLAFQTDSTRIATFLLANEGSNRAFPEIGIAEGHHHLTHHQNKQEMIDKVAEIDVFYMKQFAKFLEKMERTKDTDGNSLLHNSMIVYGSGHADANKHSHTNLPVILAGGGGAGLTPGRFTKAGGVPMSNMFLGMADRLGVQGVARLGDSTGRFGGI